MHVRDCKALLGDRGCRTNYKYMYMCVLHGAQKSITLKIKLYPILLVLVRVCVCVFY